MSGDWGPCVMHFNWRDWVSSTCTTPHSRDFVLLTFQKFVTSGVQLLSIDEITRNLWNPAKIYQNYMKLPTKENIRITIFPIAPRNCVSRSVKICLGNASPRMVRHLRSQHEPQRSPVTSPKNRDISFLLLIQCTSKVVCHTIQGAKTLFWYSPKIGLWVGEGSPNFETHQNIANWCFSSHLQGQAFQHVQSQPSLDLWQNPHHWSSPPALNVHYTLSTIFQRSTMFFNVHLPQDSTDLPNQPGHIFAWPRLTTCGHTSIGLHTQSP